ncbi:hypothetical protein IWW36_000315 [Coemansia brasiliensis]|uniref:Dilute domain-containing protein n=1 Tax=Coemansia brasiliensis TaxID=2650707 RepID=A0A9W8M333_9FUNG|nr:hypothetical protein IWW36_000315 [Coemansia brasiliensis]
MEQNDFSDEFLTEADIIASTKLTDTKKHELLSQSFARTASNGDVNALERVWETCQGTKWVDIDYRDDQGSTPLICASCFGHTHIAELLIDYGANVNLQDNSLIIQPGWTALMWATTNHNQDLVRVLLEHGASSSTKTARGHTAINIASSNLSSNSDSESCRRSSASPNTELADSTSSRLDDVTHASSDAVSVGGSKAESDGLSVGSPRSMEHSAIGTPNRRGAGRDSLAAGQTVLSMLQASSARSSGKLETAPDSLASTHDHGLLSPTRSADGSRITNEGLGLSFGDDDDGISSLADGEDNLSSRMQALNVNKRESTESTAQYEASDYEVDDENKEPQTFDWDTLQLDQMYVISPATVPQFLHAVVKDIQPERWIHSDVRPEHRFVSASMIFLAARFAHHLGSPDFLDSFLSDTIASIIHEVQTHKTNLITLAFWISNIHTLIYFFKRDSTLVQITSDAQGRMSECMHDTYALLVRALEAELEPLIDASLLAYESMPELFADVKFEAEKSQRLSMFFFGNQTDATRKSADGRPLRRSQTVLQKGGGRPRRSSILGTAKPEARVGPATASGEMPAWIATVLQLKGQAIDASSSLFKRPSSGDTFVSGRSSHDNARSSVSLSVLFSSPSPRTITFMLESLLDLLDMCEVHTFIKWGIVRQLFCYLGNETFNRVLTTRDFCSRSRAMQIRMNLSQLSDWVRGNVNRLPLPQTVKPDEQESESTPNIYSLLYKAYFDPLVELLELLQCLTHLPDLAEYFETTSKMQNLNVLQQETAAANYRYEVQESKIAADILEYLESIAKEIRDGQRAEREKKSIEKASRRSSASVFSERRTMDGRPSLLSLDMTSSNSRTSTGLVRVLADSVQQGTSDNVSLTERSAGGITLTRRSNDGNSTAATSGASATNTMGSRSRTGTRSGRRGLLIPIARPGAASNRPSVRTLFPGQTAAPAQSSSSKSVSGRNSSSSRVSESLEPISETSSVTSRQRSHTTVDVSDAHSDDSSVGMIANRLSGDLFASTSHQQQPRTPPSTAPADSSWDRTNPETGDEILSASLRGPRGKRCLPENMKELMDSSELLPFAVPTSREWLQWWQSQLPLGSKKADVQDWSNETVALHQQKQQQQQSKAVARAELAPAVPSEFLNALSQVA